MQFECVNVFRSFFDHHFEPKQYVVRFYPGRMSNTSWQQIGAIFYTLLLILFTRSVEPTVANSPVVFGNSGKPFWTGIINSGHSAMLAFSLIYIDFYYCDALLWESIICVLLPQTSCSSQIGRQDYCWIGNIGLVISFSLMLISKINVFNVFLKGIWLGFLVFIRHQCAKQGREEN